MVKISTERLLVAEYTPDLAVAMLDYRKRNREHFRRSGPTRDESFFSLDHCTNPDNFRVTQVSDSSRFSFVLQRKGHAEIVGHIVYSSLSPRPLSACYLGYGIDHLVEGQGLMFEALKATNRFIFEEVDLHRISANCEPTNERSGKLLKRLGFAVEGFARDYLFLDGAWRDHVLTSTTNPTHQNISQSTS